MTNYQESYEKMSTASVSFLNANAAITATLPNFAGYFTTIQNTHAQILVAKAQQEADKSGDIKAKNQLRATLIAQAIDIGRRMVAYATNVNNNTLLALVDYTESDLKRSSDSKLVGICQVIRNNANSNVGALASYGVTAATITTLQTSITNFNAALPKGRVDTTDSGEATKLLATLFNTLLTTWDKIDKLVEMVRTTQPAFYDEYQKVRKIIETGNGSLVLKIKATNALTGEPEANVTVTLEPLNGQLKAATANGKSSIVKKTAKGGGANVKSMADGSYTFTAKKPGFKEVTETINVVNGEMTVLEIKMEKA
jgi:hypothetical protein